jgi:hypothetical protein
VIFNDQPLDLGLGELRQHDRDADVRPGHGCGNDPPLLTTNFRERRGGRSALRNIASACNAGSNSPIERLPAWSAFHRV